MSKTKFRCVVRRDAYVNYECVVAADTVEDAASTARNAFMNNDDRVEFEEVGLCEFDDVVCDPEDCEEVPE